MKILMTGATGFIGSHLSRRLMQDGHALVVLSRSVDKAKRQLGAHPTYFRWEPGEEALPADSLTGVGAVIHLLGESIAAHRWSHAQKKIILESRLLSTRSLGEALQKTGLKPVVVAASAVGIYGNRGDESLDEKSTRGTGFLSDVTAAWERESDGIPACRLIKVRIGAVLGNDGGLLAKLLPVFRMGLGGPVGNGKQWVPWVHIEDLVEMILYLLNREAASGVYNGTAPQPVTNSQFSRALGKALHRPALLRTPSMLLKLGMGEMADLALWSQRVLPERAQSAGFTFRFPTIERALSDLFPAKE